MRKSFLPAALVMVLAWSHTGIGPMAESQADALSPVLDRIAAARPKCLWVLTVTQDGLNVEIAGNSAVSRLVKEFYGNLSKDALFASVKIGQTYEVKRGVNYTISLRVTNQSERVTKKRILWDISVAPKTYREEIRGWCYEMYWKHERVPPPSRI